MIYVNKVAETLWFRYNVLFINEKGIYKDSNMKKLITTDKTKIKEAIAKTEIYDYYFTQDEYLNFNLYEIKSGQIQMK